MTTTVDTRIPKKPPASGGSGIDLDVDGSPYVGVTTLGLDAGPGIVLTPSGASPSVDVEIAADQSLGPVFLIQPGGTPGPNVFTSAAAAEAAIAALGLKGRRWIRWDNSLNGFAPIVMGVGAYTELVTDAVWYQSVSPFSTVLIDVPEGVTWTALPSVQQGIIPNFKNTATPTFVASGTTAYISVMESGAGFKTDPTCTIPPLDIPAGTLVFFFLAFQSSLYGTGNGGGAPLISTGPGSTLLVVMNAFGTVDYDTVTGDGNVSWIFNTHSSIAGEQPGLTTPPGFTVFDPQQAANEYWIDTTQTRDLAKHRYPNVSDAVAAGVASGIAVGTAIVIHLPDTAESIPCDLTGGNNDYPIILRGPGGEGQVSQVTADLTPNDGLTIPASLLVQRCRVDMAGMDLIFTDGDAETFEDVVAPGIVGTTTIGFSGDGNGTLAFIRSDLDDGSLDLHIAIQAENGAAFRFDAKGSTFYSVLDDGTPFVLVDTTTTCAPVWDTADCEIRVDAPTASGGVSEIAYMDTGGDPGVFNSRDDRITAESVGATTDNPVLIAFSNDFGDFTGEVTNLRINAKNATMGSGTNPWDQYVAPGLLLQQLLLNDGASLVWEGETKTREITGPTTYQLAPEDTIIVVDSSAGAATITLVDPGRCPGRAVMVHRKGTDNNAITLDATSAGGTIDDGNLTVDLPNGQSCYRVKSISVSGGYEWRTE